MVGENYTHMVETSQVQSLGTDMSEAEAAQANALQVAQAALMAIWQTERDRLIARCTSLLRNREEALDCASEALVRCLPSALDDRNLPALLHVTARNLALSLIQARKRIADPTWFDRLETDNTATNELFARQCIDRLAVEPEFGELLIAFEANGYDKQATAEALGLSKAALGMRLVRARRALGVEKIWRMPRLAAQGPEYRKTIIGLSSERWVGLWYLLSGPCIEQN